MHLPRENPAGVELTAAPNASLRSLEEEGRLRGWIVILSADAKRGCVSPTEQDTDSPTRSPRGPNAYPLKRDGGA